MKYNSRFGAEKQITVSQYIAELLIEREAQKYKTKLPNQFWKNMDFKVWTGKFLKQKRRADGLLRTGYSAEAILSAVKKLTWCFSLFNQQLELLVHEEDRKINNQKKITEQPIIEKKEVTKPKMQQSISKANKKSKLKD